MSGWIKIHRSITNHWLYTEKRVFSKFEAWNDILLTVNYIDAKTMIKGTLYEVKRGQSILSLDSWSKRWNWDKSKVRRFLNALQLDDMLVIKSDTVTTRLTICNYESYQGERNANETQMKHKRNADETQMTPIEERKNNKENIYSFFDSLIEYGFNKDLVNDWIKVRKAKKLTNTKTAFDKFILEVQKSKLDKNEILKTCVEKSWGGFNSNWIEEEKPVYESSDDALYRNVMAQIAKNEETLKNQKNAN
jgi:hypothetical protein